MLSFSLCPEESVVCTSAVHPWYWSSGCPCSSWPRMAWTVTCEQSIVPSSGSLTVTAKFTLSPQSNNPPPGGAVMVRVGAVLPEVMVTLAVPVAPAEFVTVSTAV